MASLVLQLKRRLPEPLKRSVKQALFAGTAHHCPCCGSNLRRLVPHGRPPRAHARCEVCGALERHRLARLVIEREGLLGRTPGEVLYHFAPEPVMAEYLTTVPGLRYVSADIVPGRAMETQNLCELTLADDSVDVIFCSHVLEHVPDDAAAMYEIARVLKPTGRAILMVPQRSGPTYEDASIVDPEARHWAFGRFDHLRFYGDDFEHRLRAAGLEVKTIATEDLGDEAFRVRHGLLEYERVFVATPANAA